LSPPTPPATEGAAVGCIVGQAIADKAEGDPNAVLTLDEVQNCGPYVIGAAEAYLRARLDGGSE
jgi:hypothetical protein